MIWKKLYRIGHKLWYWSWESHLENRLHYVHITPAALGTRVFLTAEELVIFTKNHSDEEWWGAVRKWELSGKSHDLF